MNPRPLYGPHFSSYTPDDVVWLLTDLSSVDLEAPSHEREAAIQGGTAHYSESLPIEYQPTAQYLDLFHETLEDAATRVAHAAAVACEVALLRHPSPVFVSLARAGTPIGILMRRWADFAHKKPIPHYTISIIRGRGIDHVAMRYLAQRYDPAQIVFIDGWTGKGAICRELRQALETLKNNEDLEFDPTLVVLADPGRCASVYGTRDDFLIPSACLNSTVSGLVSRTVLNDNLIGPHMFHGAKFYKHLMDADVSTVFLNSICAHFPQVSPVIARERPYPTIVDPYPDWAGWRVSEEICEQFGLGDINLVKPGVGETTRVLLRRIPWRVLVRRDAMSDLAHIVMLAKQRGVPLEEVDDLPYSCVGLIRPVKHDWRPRELAGKG